MSNLTLDERGTAFARNQRRIADYLRILSEKHDLHLDIQADNYIVQILMQSTCL